jgi:Uma2 family endonuclease
LVVEVHSPSSRRIDLGSKRLAFEGGGVPSYWLVDPDVPSMTVLEFEEGAHREVAHVIGDEAFTTARPFPVTIVPVDLVR